jgi:hypothetical protein
MEFDEKRAKVEKQVLEYLIKRKFKEASLTVAAYEAEQPNTRGIGIDWRHYNPDNDIKKLKTIFESKPKILARLKNENLDAVRIATAMMALWGTNKAKKWLPVDFKTNLLFDNDTTARMLLFYAQNQASLDQYHHEGLKLIEFLPASDSCEACKKLAGEYKLNKAPELPHEHCTHKMGCRCTFLPVVA